MAGEITIYGVDLEELRLSTRATWHEINQFINVKATESVQEAIKACEASGKAVIVGVDAGDHEIYFMPIKLKKNGISPLK